MPIEKTLLELLVPAQNAVFGTEALRHGADAVYIGAPKFGARQAVGNSVRDIETLCRQAHTFGAKVYATLNTLLFDNELEDAVKMAWDLHHAGINGLIIQDLGLLESGLPPVKLIASTQTHNVELERIQFLEACGFKRIILARELGLTEIQNIRQNTTVELEAFVHGALCVGYSGQCYMGLFLANRSGNRGVCAQPCRSRYDVLTQNGKILVRNKYLLSLKDLNRSACLQDLVDTGITSFKIEGRLKDLSYVKNITAFYRKKLDLILEEKPEFQKASSGKTRFFFEPEPEKTFNRGFTDYFCRNERRPMASINTPKALGALIGQLAVSPSGDLLYAGNEILAVGDGLCYFDENSVLQGFSVNKRDGKRLIANKKITLKTPVDLYRNVDVQFEKQLTQKTAERKIDVDFCLAETETGFRLMLKDEDNIEFSCDFSVEKQPAQKPETAVERRQSACSKLGHTPFHLRNYSENTRLVYFIPDTVWNSIKNNALTELEAKRQQCFFPKPVHREQTYPQHLATLDFSSQVVNSNAKRFYQKCGAEVKEYGLDYTQDFKDKPLMRCKYCLKFEMGQCSKTTSNLNPNWQQPLMLKDNHGTYALKFDCAACEMRIYAV